MAYTAQTNAGTHPKHPEWIGRGSFKTAQEAWSFIENQSATSDGEPTAFGLNGRRVIDDAGAEYFGPQDPAVIYGGAAPYSRAPQ